jgi:hypothetical protein
MGLLYITDYIRDHAPEAFASINVRNIYSFGLYTSKGNANDKE